ncbi:hypothetical protein OVA03_14770 [Asticcacaulis sp. SL142]|uniref:hypothetical protein n=1 Tax=Asticcacaulis sp. SL142 TaxID=2995155 RepID=UPI00226CC1CB|nr:hypothetical protein [Asticcacaulis sp. SL142]WAC47948.1 hypothetical protein OVA03_14770 [Asticcacaulis sp. SL142]
MVNLRIRLYDGALVEAQGLRGPLTAVQCPNNPTHFEISGFLYDASGRAALPRTRVPKILMVYSTGCQLLKTA